MDKKPPEMVDSSTPESFDRIVDMAKAVIDRLKSLDYAAIEDELTQLNVHIPENPSLHQLNLDIQKVQMARDRAAEIFLQSQKHFMVKKRMADLICETWSRFSRETSVDRRIAEAKLKAFEFIADSTEAEILHRAAMHVLKNLDVKRESLSRQVTIFGLMLQMRDVGRGIPEGTDGNQGLDDFEIDRPAKAEGSGGDGSDWGGR